MIGGDTQVAAVSAAISLGDRFMVEGPGIQAIRVCLERNAQCFKGSVQLAGRKKPPASPNRFLGRVRFEQRIGGLRKNSAGQLGETDSFGPLSPIFTGSGTPDWAEWFADELNTHRAIIPALGVGCDPVIVKGEKEQFLDWLSWGGESGAIRFPCETGSVRWPRLNLEDLFLPAKGFLARGLCAPQSASPAIGYKRVCQD